jgi:nucleoside-diphosphate-sugar epimerase
VKVIEQDALNLEVSFLRDFDQVIFLAGLSNDPMAEYSPTLTYIENVAAPGCVAYLAKKAGVARFIYAETCSVYGIADKIATEKAPTKTEHAYGISKLCGGIAASVLADDTFSVIRLRKGTISGYSSRMRFDLLVNAMYKAAITEGRLHVSNPIIWRPFLAMTDAIEAYLAAVKADRLVSGEFNISSGNFTIGVVARRVARYFRTYHNTDPRIVETQSHDARNYRVSTKKARLILRFEPTGTIESVLHELDNCVSPNCDFDDDSYHNIKILMRTHRQASGSTC